MKFYQIIASVIISIMCATTIFGSEVDIRGLSVPADILKKIDGFAGKNREKNDSFYKKTGHVQCYASLFDLMTSYSTAKSLSRKDRPTMINNITTLIFIVLSAGLKIFSQILPSKVTLPLTSLSKKFLNPVIGLGNNHIVPNQLAASHLGIKSPAEIAIWDDRQEIVITDIPASNEIRKIEIRSLFNMQLKKVRQLSNIPQIYHPRRQKKLVKQGRTYVLKRDGQIHIYLANDDYKPPKDKNNNPQPKHDYISGNKLYSLPTPKKVTAFDVSFNGIIVTVQKDGSITKWELKCRKSLHKIMNTD